MNLDKLDNPVLINVNNVVIKFNKIGIKSLEVEEKYLVTGE